MSHLRRNSVTSLGRLPLRLFTVLASLLVFVDEVLALAAFEEEEVDVGLMIGEVAIVQEVDLDLDFFLLIIG